MKLLIIGIIAVLAVEGAQFSRRTSSEHHRKDGRKVHQQQRYIEEQFKEYEQKGKLSSSQSPTPHDIQFQLFTRSNVIEPHILDARNKSTILSSPINSTLHTVIIAHGFTEDADLSPWMKAIKEHFLLKETVNVIFVQWAPLADLLNYYTAARNARYVGGELAGLLAQLKVVSGLRPERLYMIGFSLGAHVVGVAGHHFPGVARITGLDPAGPDFEGRPINERLDQTDAKFVDVIHTNYGSIYKLHFGYTAPLGHVDFYVNGGELQPGCPDITADAIVKFLSGDIQDFHSCNHDRAYYYYIEALKTAKPSLGFLCQDYVHFQTGKCLRNHTNILGLHAVPDKRGVFYLDTQSSSPYLSQHIEVRTTIGQINSTTTGSLTLIAYPLDRISQEPLIQPFAAYSYKTGDRFVSMLLLPLADSLSTVPMQLEFARSELHLFRMSTLIISELKITNVEEANRSTFVCDTTLHSRVWLTVLPGVSRCYGSAPFN